jgi:hypothetical protein
MTTLLGHKKERAILQKWKEQGCKDPPYYIISGQSGIGKRTLIQTVFSEYEMSVFSSEDKKKDILEEITKKVKSTTFGDFFSGFVKTLVLIEDIDKAIGDAKFYKGLIKIIAGSKYPILMTCKLKKRVYKHVINLLPICNTDIINFIKPKYNLPLEIIKCAVKQTKGDIRSCMNILNLAEITKSDTGIGHNDSYLISGDAINDVLTNRNSYTDEEMIHICEPDFQNISEMLFYNIPSTFKQQSKSKNKSASKVKEDLESLTKMAKVYDGVSCGDILMKKIHKGYKNTLLVPFLTVSCLPIIKNIHSVNKFKHTKLSIPYNDRTFPTDIISYFGAFKYIIIPRLLNERILTHYSEIKISKELFIKTFRLVSNRVMKTKEKTILEECYVG